MKTFLAGAALLWSTMGFAQNQINGVVKSVNGELLAGAYVIAEGLDKSTITDANGKFSFDLSPGKYSIMVSFVGYETLSKKVNSPGMVDITMRESTLITDEVVVASTRITEKAPLTFSSIDHQELEKANLGQDIPYLLRYTPSVVTTSDAGAGIGYTGIRIRGSDATRINVTLNGIPYNDSESQGVYWVDLPDFASSVENIQIQRGVGTSTNGAGAFGGSINIQTTGLKQNAYATIENSFGSFNSRKHSLSAGTGLLNNAFSVDARVSKIKSDGYIDRASSDLSSFYLSGGYYGKKSLLKLNIFSGKEYTYQSWWGTHSALLDTDRTSNYYTYDNEVDDYQQDHFQLLFSQQLADTWVINSALHYTHGFGYFEQYKDDEDFSTYGITAPIINDSIPASTDIIRRRWLDNDFYGFTYSLNHSGNSLDFILGGAWNKYEGAHFGEVVWAEYAGNSAIRDRYYDNDGVKTDFNTYAKLSWSPINDVLVFGDIQYRNIGYSLDGIDSDQQVLDESHTFNFLNPKVGVTYDLNSESNVYASFSVGNKEPSRSDFVDNPDNSTPVPETLRNIEAGYRKTSSRMILAANAYLMDYNNQLVPTGALNDVGTGLRANVNDSYRAGIELEVGYQVAEKLALNGNVTYSQNKIKEFTEVLYDYGVAWDEYNFIENDYENTDIAFSPSVIAGGGLTFAPVQSLELSWLHKYVGKQYLDNTSDEARILEAYYVSDFRLNYTLETQNIGDIVFNIMANNVFNTFYESNGYTYGYFGGGDEYREVFYYPQAGFNFLVGVALKF